MQFQLTGIADYGSGTTLATLDANTAGHPGGARVLTPLITPRDSGLLPRSCGLAGAARDRRG